MNSTSLPLRAPMSSIINNSGYFMGFNRPLKEKEIYMGTSMNPKVVTPISSENSHYNIDFGRGMRANPGPSMSTPLNVFQTTNSSVWHPERYNLGAKSMTSSLNPSVLPQRFSSYSQTPYLSLNMQFPTDSGYNPSKVPNYMHNGGNAHNMFQSVQYKIQPQVIPPNFVNQHYHHLQFQNKQSPFGTNNERFIGFTSNFPVSGNAQINPSKGRTFEPNIMRMNTSTGNIQPQVHHVNPVQANIGVPFFNGKAELPPNFAPEVTKIDNELNGEYMKPRSQFNTITSGVTIKGYKPTVVTENQDRSLIIELGGNASAYAVFDGHGPHGDVVADFVSKRFTYSILQLLKSSINEKMRMGVPPTRQQIKNFFIVLFHNMDLQLSELRYGISMWSGCTAAVCLRIYDEVHIAWVGDSRVVIYKFSEVLDSSGSTDLNQLATSSIEPSVSWWTTSDHVPNRPDELSRITDCGASITVYSTPWLNKSTIRIREHGIAMSRSFGDKAGSQFGVISRPDMASIKLDPSENPRSLDRWAIVVASDGIWDSLSEEEVGYKIMKNLIWRDSDSHETEAFSQFKRPTQEEIANLANSIASEAWGFRASVENYSDDTTLIISII
ncbi:PP2C phosphatase [Cryptosporidium felis]|nr:PP2C phosphatase [Cryptosporidium felis]